MSGELELGTQRYDITRRCLLMGIINVTPDSFSDGGRFVSPEQALSQARYLMEQGADLLDIGGESTRPGATPVGAKEEIARVVPAIEAIRAAGISAPISIDTQKARVAEAALDAGADFVNDVSALVADPELGALIATRGVAVVLMHHRGSSQTMYERAHYEDVAEEVRDELAERVEAALKLGIARERIILDPGIGFAKKAPQSWQLLDRLSQIVEMGFPVLVGTSRKSFLGEVFGDSAEQRERGTQATSIAAAQRGARILRVHEPGAYRNLRLHAA
ncbi:MAG: dihydropteroate synthase [Chrysiogenetes bacterium]|nr:dihydropteroate synthase [Chrysiogenetes bacterium]